MLGRLGHETKDERKIGRKVKVEGKRRQKEREGRRKEKVEGKRS